MATFYGTWVATDDFRAILEATVSNTSDTQCTVKLVLKVQSNYAYAGSSGRASVTCNGTTRSDDVSYDAGETTTLMTETFTVARGSADKSINVSGKVWQLNASSAYAKGSTASGKVTIPAIDYDAPSAPSSCSASRASDTQAKVTWKNGGTSTTKPRSSTKVERQTDGGSWVQVASVGSSTTSYTDNSVSANHRYRYRVRAQGAGGYSSYATSGYIYTTPAAPQSVDVAVATGTTCTVDVDGSNAPYAESWEVQSQLNGGEWQTVGSYSTFPQTADIGGGTVRLRARSLRGSLASAWAESATITTIMPPLAPTVALDPSGVQPTGTAVTVEWTPAHPDGSAQTQAQVEVTVGGGSPTTADVTGATTTYQLPATATESPATVSVRVRTHGADEDWGAWSEPVTLTVAEPPSVAITSPGTDGAVVADLPLVVTWTVSDATGVAAQLLEVVGDDGSTLHSARLDGAARSYELGSATYLLANLTDYALRLTVTGGSTLQATAERDFTVSFAEPSAPTVDTEVDESDMSVELTVHAGPSSTDAGEVVTVAEHAPAGTPVPGFTVYGNTRQNLWANPRGTRNGVTVTSNADGSITLSGTATGWAILQIRSYALRPGATYALGVDKKLSDSIELACVELTFLDADGEYIGEVRVGYASTLTASFSTPANTGSVYMRVRVASGVTVSGTYRVMLNEGSTTEPWCPPGLNSVDELSIVTSNGNLWENPSGTNSGVTVTDNADGSMTLSGTPTGGNHVISSSKVYTLVTGRTYTVSVDQRVQTGCTYQVRLLNSAGDAILNIIAAQTGRSFTVPPGIVSATFLFYFNSANIDGAVSGTYRVMLNEGSEAKPWVEPDTATVTPVDLDGHTLNSLPDGTRDELRVDATGAVTLVKRVGTKVLPGDAVSWHQDSSSPALRYSTGISPNAPSVYAPGTVMSDALPPRNATDDGFNSTSIITATAVAIATIGSGETAQDIASTCGGKTLLYKLAEPQEISLPSVTLPSWPDGEASLWASAQMPTEMRVDYPDIDHITVQRVNPDGSLWVVGDGLTDGETVVDPLPPLNVPTDYVITAHTAAGATSELRVMITVGSSGRAAMNAGAAAGECVLTQFDFKYKGGYSHSGELLHFASGTLPVFYATSDIGNSETYDFTLLGASAISEMRSFFMMHPVCWTRTPDGRRLRCRVSATFEADNRFEKCAVSVSADEVEWGEAW